MPTKNCIIIHGCPSKPSDLIDFETTRHWIPWTKNRLIENGTPTETPGMPMPWQPDYEKFKEEFEKYEVNENTILIGHSCGCAFLVRWLGESKRKILKLILVAPWKIPKEDGGFREAYYTYPVDETIKNRVGKIIMFTADNEEPDGKKSLNIFRDALGGTVIELKGRGHYTMNDMKTEEFPELLEVCLE